jgi:ribosomal protein L37AE/L43A
MGHVHIYAPPCVSKHAIAGNCPDCKKRTRFLTLTYEWHGPDATCIKCGRSFSDGEWMPLPFVRDAREKEIARAKDRFRRAAPIGVDAMMNRI